MRNVRAVRALGAAIPRAGWAGLLLAAAVVAGPQPCASERGPNALAAAPSGLPGRQPARLLLAQSGSPLKGVAARGQGAAAGSSSRNWLNQSYGYFARNQSLRTLLFDFAATVGVPAVVSSKIQGTIDGSSPEIPVIDFLTKMSESNDLAWMFDGLTLYLYNYNEVQEETLDLAFEKSDLFRSEMDAMELIGVPLSWTLRPTLNGVRVSGPPRLIDIATDLAKRIHDLPESSLLSAAQTQSPDGLFEVRVFEIRYSFVNGSSGFDGSGQGVNLAEAVGNLMNVPFSANVHAFSKPPSVGAPMKGSGLNPKPPGDAAAAPPAAASGPVRDGAYIVAHPTLNALIVRDLKSRLPMYEELIRALDRPLDQIELEVSIIDIDASEAETLSFGWQSRYLQLNADGIGAGGPTLIYDTTLDRDEFSGLLLDVKALRERGRSRILSQPSVMTLDNHEAVFRNDATFYVRLGGIEAESVDLVPVTYGATIRIRPHVVRDGDVRKILLNAHLQDGRRRDGANDVTGVPEVAENVITTNALVEEGQSLLVGGYRIQERSSDRKRLPFVGRIPVLGALFGSRSSKDIAIARYFVISPRIVPASIAYEVNTGFEDSDDDVFGAVKPVENRSN